MKHEPKLLTGIKKHVSDIILYLINVELLNIVK